MADETYVNLTVCIKLLQYFFVHVCRLIVIVMYHHEYVIALNC